MRSETAASLRNLYFTRAAVSAVWVTLVLVVASGATTASAPTTAAIVLLTIYPLWDAVAVFLAARATRNAPSHLAQYLGIAVSLAATAGVLIALGIGLTATLIVFGVWASLSGAIQLFLALRRRRSIGGQWPMIISGGLSVLAGISFILTASAPRTGLTTLAGYSAFGAFWYLVGAIWLAVAGRRKA
jgi:uncharacterized membrane protein HdeD (DUF308 family)